MVVPQTFGPHVEAMYIADDADHVVDHISSKDAIVDGTQWYANKIPIGETTRFSDDFNSSGSESSGVQANGQPIAPSSQQRQPIPSPNTGLGIQVGKGLGVPTHHHKISDASFLTAHEDEFFDADDRDVSDRRDDVARKPVVEPPPPEEPSYIRYDGRDVVVDLVRRDAYRSHVPENTTKLTLSKPIAPLPPILPTLLSTVASTLTTLDLSYANLTELPSSSFLVLAACREMNISHNPLGKLLLWQFPPSLQLLKADSCRLESIVVAPPASNSPAEKSRPPKYLRHLSLRHNHLESLPSHLCLFRYLRYLHLENNAFSGHWLEVVALLDPNEQRRRRDIAEVTRRQKAAATTQRPFSAASEMSISASSVSGRSRSGSVSSTRLRKIKSNGQLMREGRSFSSDAGQPPMPSGPYLNNSSTASVPSLPRSLSSTAALPLTQSKDDEQSSRRRSGSVGSTNGTVSGSGAQAKWGFLKKIVGADAPPANTSRMASVVQDAMRANKNSGTRSRSNSEALARLQITKTSNGQQSPNIDSPMTSASALSPPLTGFSAGNSPIASPIMSENDFEELRDGDEAVLSPTSAMAPLSQTLQAMTIPSATREQEDAELSRQGVSQLMEYLSDMWDLEGHKSRRRRHRRKTNESRERKKSDATEDLQMTRPRRSKSSASMRNDSKTMSVMSQDSVYSSGEDDEAAPSAPSPPPVEERKTKDDPYKRWNIISETLSTEKTYVSGLNELVEIYLHSPAAQQFQQATAQSAGSMSAAEERRVIFSNLENLTAFHKDHFLPALEAAVDSAKASMMVSANDEGKQGVNIEAAEEIGKLFCQFAAWMKMYSVYVNNFDGACTLLSRWTSLVSMSSSNLPSTYDLSPLNQSPNESVSQLRKRVKHYFAKCKSHPLHSQINLQSYLLLPVQRIPRYKMLLQDLLANSQRDVSVRNAHAVQPLDWLPRATQQIEALATEMNERKREAEGRAKLVEWQGRIKGRFRSPLVQPHRKLVLDGKLVLTKIVKKSSGSEGSANVVRMDMVEQEVWGLVCSDVLVVLADPTGAPAGTSPSNTMELVTVLRLDSRSEPAKVSRGQNLLRVYDEQAVLYFRCKDEDEAMRWRKAVNIERW